MFSCRACFEADFTKGMFILHVVAQFYRIGVAVIAAIAQGRIDHPPTLAVFCSQMRHALAFDPVTHKNTRAQAGMAFFGASSPLG